MKTRTGLDILVHDVNLQNSFKGNIALLCSNASVDANLMPAALSFKKMFGNRFIKLFGPQHGFFTNAQDNMIETDHIIHPFLNIPVYSLYSETRIPTVSMLEGIKHLFVDLQDIGCRMYTYIYTLTLLIDACEDIDIEIVILDRPNPLNGETLEGNILDLKFSSFIGLYPIPVRHALTIGEVALMHQQFWSKNNTKINIVKMQNWTRNMFFEDTKLPWILPSPNLPRTESALTFPSLVLFEGTVLSEGRGTTQPLEIVGHPKIASYAFFSHHLEHSLKKTKLKGVAIRPINFTPTFDKHKEKVCGGFQLHITDKNSYQPWRTGQWLMQELFHYLEDDFKWLSPPFEYDYTNFPIDIINGTDTLRHWVENKEPLDFLNSLEEFDEYKNQLNSIKLYH